MSASIFYHTSINRFSLFSKESFEKQSFEETVIIQNRIFRGVFHPYQKYGMQNKFKELDWSSLQINKSLLFSQYWDANGNVVQGFPSDLWMERCRDLFTRIVTMKILSFAATWNVSNGKKRIMETYIKVSLRFVRPKEWTKCWKRLMLTR